MPFTVNKYLRSDLHDITITLIGAGGNGSFMLTNLARINYALRAMGKKGLYVHLVDFDTVSETNVGRQLFSPSDIGKNKAEVLIDRVNRAFGTSWLAVNKKVDEDFDYHTNIVITAVDNVLARREIQALFYSNINSRHDHELHKKLYWLDMGNGKDFGQVILTDGKRLPGLFDFFPDLKDTGKDGPSCSMVQALKKQDLFVNSILTQFAGKLVYDLLTKPKLDYHGAFMNLKTMDLKPIKR